MCTRLEDMDPYWYLRYEEFDRAPGAIRYRHEYVSRSEVRRVRRWIRREQTENAETRGVLTLLREWRTGSAARKRTAGKDAQGKGSLARRR